MLVGSLFQYKLVNHSEHLGVVIKAWTEIQNLKKLKLFNSRLVFLTKTFRH